MWVFGGVIKYTTQQYQTNHHSLCYASYAGSFGLLSMLWEVRGPNWAPKRRQLSIWLQPVEETGSAETDSAWAGPLEVFREVYQILVYRFTQKFWLQKAVVCFALGWLVLDGTLICLSHFSSFVDFCLNSGIYVMLLPSGGGKGPIHSLIFPEAWQHAQATCRCTSTRLNALHYNRIQMASWTTYS